MDENRKPKNWRDMVTEQSFYDLLTTEERQELEAYQAKVKEQMKLEAYLTIKAPSWYLWWKVSLYEKRNFE